MRQQCPDFHQCKSAASQVPSFADISCVFTDRLETLTNDFFVNLLDMLWHDPEHWRWDTTRNFLPPRRDRPTDLLQILARVPLADRAPAPVCHLDRVL